MTQSEKTGAGPTLEQGTTFMTLEGRYLEGREPVRGRVITGSKSKSARFDIIVVGGGQAGLSVGYHLSRLGVNFVILDANKRIGDQWRRRWDSLRLFTPAKFDGLDGMRFPAPKDSFPTKDQMADYLESYAARFKLPVRTSVRVSALTREDGRYEVMAGDTRFEAGQVIVAAASYQKPRTPDFAKGLDPEIVQIHSRDYRNPGQLRDGKVLLVGAGNSGAEIARELSAQHSVYMSGRDVGQIPFRIDGFLGRHFLVRLVVRGIFHRVLTVKTPPGRKARPKLLAHGGPLIRVKGAELSRLGVERVARVKAAVDGKPMLEDGRVLDVANVIWCTGYTPGLDWIKLPIADADGYPRHESGVVPDAPGLYFVGMHFLYSLSSAMIHGVGRDAQRIAKAAASHLLTLA